MLLFGLGLFNASLFAASILPLATAYSVCEGLGFEAGVNKSFREAAVFYWLYTLLINRVDLMGEYTNSRSYNLVAWSTLMVVIVLTFILLVGGLRG